MCVCPIIELISYSIFSIVTVAICVDCGSLAAQDRKIAVMWWNICSVDFCGNGNNLFILSGRIVGRTRATGDYQKVNTRSQARNIWLHCSRATDFNSSWDGNAQSSLWMCGVYNIRCIFRNRSKNTETKRNTKHTKKAFEYNSSLDGNAQKSFLCVFA